jgi:hypothetical protein
MRLHDACTIDERFERPWQPLKGISIKNIYVPELSYPTTKKYINLRGYLTKKFRACGVIDTACTIFAFENRSYLGEFEAELKKALARESGAQGYCLMKKTEGRKSRDTVPLNMLLPIVLLTLLYSRFLYNFSSAICFSIDTVKDFKM